MLNANSTPPKILLVVELFPTPQRNVVPRIEDHHASESNTVIDGNVSPNTSTKSLRLQPNDSFDDDFPCLILSQLFITLFDKCRR